MNKFLFLIFTLFCGKSFSQTGNFTATFTPLTSSAKNITVKVSRPVFKSDNAHGYWFVNPHNNYRHFQIMPDAGYGNTDAIFVTLNNNANDIDLYTPAYNDSNEVMLKSNGYFITPPEYDPKKGDQNKPMHIHIDQISASEISFTISGCATLGTEKENGSILGDGTIVASGHFYRQPFYEKSESMAGCDCDPTIYAATYSREENMRTTSACENALGNKIFDAVQEAFAPVFTNIGYGGKGAMKPGQINVDILAGHININVPPKERPWCFSDYYHNRITGIDAQKKLYSNEDGYGLRLIIAPEDNIGSDQFKQTAKQQAAIMDSIGKLMRAGKITSAEFMKAMEDYSKKITDASGVGDVKKGEAEGNLYITILFNPANREMMLQKTADINHVIVTHNIKGSAFEIFSPLTKESNGDWIPARYYIYLGKFTAPVRGRSGGGFDAEVTTAVYPANAAKLGIYDIVIKMEGNKALADKVTAAMKMDALQALITRQ